MSRFAEQRYRHFYKESFRPSKLRTCDSEFLLKKKKQKEEKTANWFRGPATKVRETGGRKEGRGERGEKKRFLENLGTCVRHILYIQDFVLVYHVQWLWYVLLRYPPSLLSRSWLDCMRSIQGQATECILEAVTYVFILLGWLESCMNEHAQKKPSLEALHWYRLQRYCSLVHSKLAVNFVCEESDISRLLPKEIPKYDERTTEI